MKGALAAPLVFLGAAIAAWGSSQPSPAIWILAIAFLAAAWIQAGRTAPGFTPLALAIWAYVAWTVASTGFFSAVYNPAGLFDPVFLLVGFSLGRASEEAGRQRTFALFATGAAMLAVWALGQVSLGLGRGQALFETPNTLASVLNLMLVPAVVLVASGLRGRKLGLLVTLLFAGLCATFSRGAAIALVIGLIVSLAVFNPQGVRWRHMARVGVLFFAGAALTAVAVGLRAWLHTQDGGQPLFPPFGSVSARLELYALAWQSAMEHLCCGVGYLGFRMILEAGRALVPSYGETHITYFVHNDYLQVLLELGAPGLLALIAVVLLPFIIALRAMPARQEDRRIIAAVIGALAATAVHAMGDFPLHVPICLLLFGMYLGAAERLLAPAQALAARWCNPAARIAQILLSASFITLLGRPVVAEGAVAYAMKKWQQGEGRAAAFGFELARRLESRDWRYHLYAGQFWFSEAAVGGKPDAAQLADEAFAAGIRSNRFDTADRLGRVFTQIRFGALLAAPVGADTLRKWADEALTFAPLNPAVRKEHAEILRQLEAKR